MDPDNHLSMIKTGNNNDNRVHKLYAIPSALSFRELCWCLECSPWQAVSEACLLYANSVSWQFAVLWRRAEQQYGSWKSPTANIRYLHDIPLTAWPIKLWTRVNIHVNIINEVWALRVYIGNLSVGNSRPGRSWFIHTVDIVKSFFNIVLENAHTQTNIYNYTMNSAVSLFCEMGLTCFYNYSWL